jgi:hypothetical protein
MTIIDPFYLRIPQVFLQNPETRDYFERLNRFANETWTALTGGTGSDLITETAKKELFPWDITPRQTVIYSSVSTAYTTTGYERILIVTSPTTITLNANPADGEIVSVKRRTAAGNVVISGTIDGASSYTILLNNEGVTLMYSVEALEWLII